MLFKEAFNKMKESGKIPELDEKGYFLNSGIAMLPPETYILGDWILTYYNEPENKVIQAVISGESVEIKEPAEPINPSKHALETGKIKTSDGKMLEKAKEKFLEFQKPLSQIIISLHQVDFPVWRFSFITKTLEVVTVEINAENGEITRSEIANLTKTA